MPIITTGQPSPIQTTLSPLLYYVDGAIVKEALDSDAGNIIALDRKEAVKRYIVQCPFLDDKPTKYLKSVFPQGQNYPGVQAEYKGLVVYGWDEGERIGVQEWHCAVIYRTSDELQTLGWVGEGEFSEEQESIVRDINGKLIGHSVYRVMPDDSAVYDAHCDSAQGKQLKLKRTGAFKKIPTERYRSVHRFSMTRVLTALIWRQVRTVGGLTWTINDSKFLTYKPGELAFTNFGWREVFGALPSAPATSKQYEVRLQFAANPDLWSPVKLYETFTDEEGFESPVIEDSEGSPQAMIAVEREYYRPASFSQIFSTLNVTAPA